MRQIQYQQVFETPAPFPPPATINQYGWDHVSDPNPQQHMDRRDYRTRGGGYRALADTQNHAVFALPQWAIPGQTIGTFYGPQNPQLWMDRREQAAKRQARGGGYRALYDTQSHAVFAIEQWAIPGQTIGTFYGPANPQQFSRRQEYRLRGGGYRDGLDTQSHAVFAMGEWPLPGGQRQSHIIIPDTPHQLLHRVHYRGQGGGYRSLHDGAAVRPDPVTSTVVFTPAELPDDPRLGRARTRVQPGLPAVYAIEQWDVPVGWGAWNPDTTERARQRLREAGVLPLPTTAVTPTILGSYPDTTARRVLSAAQHKGTAGQAPEALRFLDWLEPRPDATARRVLPVSRLPYAFRAEAPEVLRWLDWVGSRPETTARARLPVALVPSVFRGEAPGVFQFLDWLGSRQDVLRRERPQTRIDGLSYALRDLDSIPAWFRPSLPDTTARLALTPARVPFLARPEVQTAAPALVCSLYPEATRRLALRTAAIPAAFRGEDPGGYRRTLLASATYPDTTWRKALAAAAIPSQFRGEDPGGYRRTLLASTQYPDTTRRRSLHPGLFPSVQWTNIQVGPVWAPVAYPDRTLRLALWPSAIPSFTEGYRTVVPTPGWGSIAPDRTWRLVLPVSALPFLFWTEQSWPTSQVIAILGSYLRALPIAGSADPADGIVRIVVDWAAGVITVVGHKD